MEKSVLKINRLENDYFVEDAGRLESNSSIPKNCKDKTDSRIVRGIIKDKTLMKNGPHCLNRHFYDGMFEQVNFP